MNVGSVPSDAHYRVGCAVQDKVIVAQCTVRRKIGASAGSKSAITFRITTTITHGSGSLTSAPFVPTPVRGTSESRAARGSLPRNGGLPRGTAIAPAAEGMTRGRRAAGLRRSHAGGAGAGGGTGAGPMRRGKHGAGRATRPASGAGRGRTVLTGRGAPGARGRLRRADWSSGSGCAHGAPRRVV